MRDEFIFFMFLSGIILIFVVAVFVALRKRK